MSATTRCLSSLDCAVFSPGYTRRRHTYSFRAYVDEHGWNRNRYRGPLKLWDLNWRKSHNNIVRVVRGKRHFVVLFGRKYRRLGWPRA